MIKISACVIVKNEERHMERWFAGLSSLADEYIVVDTGSTDRTVEIARAHGARLYDFEWIDDFSAAKNFALEQAGGNWIVFLDADEYFSPESLPKIRLLLEQLEPRTRTAGVLCRWVNIDEDNGNELQGASLQLRLFRNRHSLRYEGSVHEALAVPKNQRVELSRELVIYHTGYSAGMVRGKLLRNRSLLEKRIAAKGGEADAQDKQYLMDCAYGLGEYEQAAGYGQAIIDQLPAGGFPVDSQRRLYETWISALIEAGRSGQEILAAMDQAIAACPDAADFLFMKGLYLYKKGQDGTEAQRCLHLGLEKHRQFAGTVDISDNAERFLADAQAALQVLAAANKIYISACVIAKNEEKNIQRWLDNMKEIADEIIVVDTGSTDGTVAIARDGGAKVCCFSWCNDFAAAKNYALAQASGEWILFLDADEYFSTASVPRIRAMLRQVPADTAGVLCRLINVDADDHNRFMETIVQLRMFRNSPGLRYRGAIHEAVAGIKHKKLELAEDIVIYHTGYSSGLQRQKMERNLRILRHEAEKAGYEDPQDYHYFMDCFYGLQDYAQAIAYAEKILSHPQLPERDRLNAYEIQASSYINGNYPESTVRAVLEKSAAARPEQVRLQAMQGLYLFECRDYLAAMPILRQSLQQEKQDSRQRHDEAGILNRLGRLHPFVYWKLGEIQRLKGDWEQAQTCYLQALQLNRYLPELLARFADSLQAAGVSDIDCIALLNRIYDKQQDAAFLADSLAKARYGSIYLYYARLAGSGEDKAASYMAVGRYDAAAAQFAAALEVLYRLDISAAAVQQRSVGAPLALLLPPDYQQAWRQLQTQEESAEKTKLLSALQRMCGELSKRKEKT